MRKIALLVAIVILGTASFAAAPGKLAVGTSLGWGTLAYQFSPELSGSLGISNTSGGASMTGILLKVDYALAKSGKVQPTIGGYYTTNGAAAATTTFGVVWGVATMVETNLSLGADIVVFSSTSVGGASTTNILPYATLSAAYSL